MSLISIHIEGLDRNKMPDRSALDQAFFTAFNRRGALPVTRIEQKFKDVLKPGANVDVGASGKASQNIFHKWEGGGSGIGSWDIFEGAGGANAKIRAGLPAGRKVPYNVLRKWAMDKGIQLYYDAYEGHTAILKKVATVSGFNYGQSWFKSAGTQPKPQKAMPDSSLTRSAIYAIRYALWKSGTNRPSANWYPLKPSGSGRFDYPAYVLEHDHSFIMSEVDRWAINIAEVYAKVFTFQQSQ